ncbi:MAG: HAD family hydrolase [Candidatus Acidiferrales bacterium]
MSQYTAIFWDMGGVILTNAWGRNSRRRAAEKFGLDWEEFEDRHELVLHAFETGQVGLEEYLNRVIFYRQRSFTREDFKAYMYGESQPLDAGLSVLRRLAASKKYLVAALNNESLELNDYRIRTFRLRDSFAAFFSSCYLGERKPDAAIFRAALNITQRQPQECIFIDDRPLNIEAARVLGMQAVQCQDGAQLERELLALGITLAGA